MKPKFKIGDIVYMVDDTHYNPGNEAISVGKIEAIHFIRKSAVMQLSGITYSITGFSLRPREENLKPYLGQHFG